MERRKAATTGNSLGLILIDLDHFKKINHNYGHLAGDEVLREMSRRVRKCLREYDIFGRYGGEEFLVVVPDGNLAGAMVVAERIRGAMNRAPFQVEGREIEVTASLGVTCCFDPAEGLDAALDRADIALYQAKKMGRNRVCSLEVPSCPTKEGGEALTARAASS